MTRVAERIDKHLEEAFAMELNRAFERGCCDACRAKIDGPAPADAEAPEEDARRLMLAAARTKRCLPARDRWQIDPELKKNLTALYQLYQRGMIGPCQSLREMLGPEPAVTVVSVTAASAEVQLWWELTKDGAFLDRLNQAFEPYRGRVEFARFRDDFLRRCVEREIGDVSAALELLKEQEKAYAADWLN
ncbi:hypothetical protein EDM68_05030 [Candidatus Uhrbacteria bacterium]|nr:MAG: hypothetical protein EDM68_05030 [Candidatus Uhrbacteria bacterium]